jgi:hypothetical protein
MAPYETLTIPLVHSNPDMHQTCRAQLCRALVVQIERVERQMSRGPIKSLINPTSSRTPLRRKTIWRKTQQRGLTAAKPDQSCGKNRDLFIAGRDMVHTCRKEKSISKHTLGATTSVFNARIISCVRDVS